MPRNPYFTSGPSSSMQDLVLESSNRIGPGFSTLRTANSDANLGHKFVNGSLTSLTSTQSRGPSQSPGPLERLSSMNKSNLSLSLPPPQGPPPKSNLPAPPMSPTTVKSPLGQYQIDFTKKEKSLEVESEPDGCHDLNHMDDFKVQMFELPPRKDSISSPHSSGVTRRSPPPVESRRQSEQKGSVAAAESVRVSETSSFYSASSPTRSSIAPYRESKESRSSGQLNKSQTHSNQYTISLSTQNEDENEDRERQSRSTMHVLTEHLELDPSRVPSPPNTTQSANPLSDLDYNQTKYVLRLPSLHLDNTSLIPSPLQSPATIIPSVVSSSRETPAQSSSALSTNTEKFHLSLDAEQPNSLSFPDSATSESQHFEEKSSQRSSTPPPPVPPARLRPPMLTSIATDLQGNFAGMAGPHSAPVSQERNEFPRNTSADELCHSPTWEGFWGPKKVKKKQEKAKKKEEKKRLRDQKKHGKGKITTSAISAPVPTQIPESAATAPPLRSPLLPGYTGSIKIIPTSRLDSPAIRALSPTSRVDTPMISSIQSASANTSQTRPTARAMSPTANSESTPPISPASPESHHDRFSNLIETSPNIASDRGIPTFENLRKAIGQPSTLGYSNTTDISHLRQKSSFGIQPFDINKADLENPRKAPNPPTSPHLDDSRVAAYHGRFDSMASHNSSVYSETAKKLNEPHSAVLSPVPSSPDHSKEVDEIGLFSSPEFSAIIKSKLAPPPLSPVRQLRSPIVGEQDERAQDHSNAPAAEETKGMYISTSRPNTPSGFQTPLLLQDGFGHSSSNEPSPLISPPSVGHHKFDVHLPHMSPAFGGGPNHPEKNGLSSSDDPVDYFRLKGPRPLDAMSMDKHLPKDPVFNKPGKARTSQFDDNCDSFTSRNDFAFPKRKSLHAETEQITCENQGYDTGRSEKDMLSSPLRAGISRSSTEVDEKCPFNHDYNCRGGTNPPTQSGRNQNCNSEDLSFEKFNQNHTFENFGSMIRDPETVGFHSPKIQNHELRSDNSYHNTELRYKSESYAEKSHDSAVHSHGWNNDVPGRREKDSHRRSDAIEKQSLSPFPQRSFTSCLDGRRQEFRNAQMPPMSKNVSNSISGLQSNRTFKPFVPGAQVPDDNEVSNLVAAPLDPSFKVEVPLRYGNDHSISFLPSVQARNRNDSVTYGNSWSTPQISPTSSGEQFVMKGKLPSRIERSAPTPPPSHSTVGSPDINAMNRADLSYRPCHIYLPTPSSTPVDFDDSCSSHADTPRENDTGFRQKSSTVDKPGSPSNTTFFRHIHESQTYSTPKSNILSDFSQAKFISEDSQAKTSEDDELKTPIVREFSARAVIADINATRNTIQDSLGGDIFDGDSDGSSLHSSFLDNYVHSWNGDFEQEYRERYPQLFQDETGSSTKLSSPFLGIADGGDEVSVHTNSPVPSPRIPNSSWGLLEVMPNNTRLSINDSNWPLPASLPVPQPKEKKRPSPLNIQRNSPVKGGWTKVEDHDEDKDGKIANTSMGMVIGEGVENRGKRRPTFGGGSGRFSLD